MTDPSTWEHRFKDSKGIAWSEKATERRLLLFFLFFRREVGRMKVVVGSVCVELHGN